jgi:phage terminase large subunit-like protein
MRRDSWWYTQRPNQVPPNGGWLVCLALAGRGFGKSRAGSEWLVERAVLHPEDRHGSPTEHLIVAETLSDARTICVEGPSGILRALERRKLDYRYKMSPRPMILFKNGCKIYCESADDADVGRGYTAASAWLDENAKWPQAYNSWFEGIMPSLRADLIDDHPRAFATTTPKPDKLILDWVNRTDGSVHLIRGSTFDNADNLSRQTLAEMKLRYGDTAIGRQELYGELLEAIDGALFKRSDMERNRVHYAPDDLLLTVVGVDPALTDEGDEMGVVVAGRTRDNHLYALADRSIQGAGRDAARHCWMIWAEFNADLLVIEENLGKKWMNEVFRDAYFELVGEGKIPRGTTPPIKTIDAKLGKRTRGEPVAMRMEQNRLSHVGFMPELEDQLTMFTGWDGKESPNRLDAYVHAMRHLMSTEKKRTSFISPGQFELRDQWDLTNY